MAGETSSMDFGDPRLQYTSGPNQFEPVNTRPRASSNVRGDGYWPEQSRFGHSQQPMGDAAPSAFPQAEPPNQVPPELIAQITANVINQLKTTGIEPVSPKPPANARYQPPPPPPSSSAAQWPGPLSPSSDPVSSPPPYPPHSHSPPSPYKQADVARAGSPQSQGPILQPESTNSREQFGASPQDRREAAPLNQNGESGHTRPKGPMRLSTGQEETTLEKIWGQLFDEECNPTVRLGQLLRGLAVHIIENYEPRNSIVITPAKMLRYYQDVNLPNEIYPWSIVFDDDRYSISRLYRELGCQHHLVQAQDDQRPEIPSLTPVGFQRWATLLLQAHPDEEYERLQKAVLDMPISNPDEKKERFPKECSRRLFPDSADFGIRERLQKAISKHAEVDFGTRAEGSPPRRPSTGTDSIYTSAASRQPSLSVETSSVPPTHRREPSTNNEPTRPSALGGTSIERERAPYANTPTEAVIDDTNPPPGLSKPLERERKPYSAVPGGGRAYDDDDGNAKPPRAESVSSKMGQLNSGAKTRPLSMGVMGPRAMDGAKSEFPPHHQPPNTTRRRRSPSFSQANNDFRRSDNDTRGYIPPYQASPGPVADAYDDESRRYSRDRVRRPVDDSGRDYGDSAWTRYERGPYVTEEDYGRGDARSRGGGYDYTPAGYGGPGYRS